MRKFQKPRQIAALLQVGALCVCLALAACGDATPTTAINTTPPVIGTPPFTPFSPRVFAVITTEAGTSSTSVTTTTSATDAQTPKLATSTPPASGIGNNWLRGVPCKAPCWENITPGKTTPEEALEILKKNPEIINVKEGDYKTESGMSGLDWYTTDYSQVSGYLSYHIKSTATVEFLKPEVKPYLLKDIFSFYGEPDHIIAVYGFQEGTQPQPHRVSLIYLNQGLILSNITKGPEPTLTPDTIFTEVFFFVPGQQGFNFVDSLEDLRGDVMVEWQGFKDFKYYCRRGSASTGVRNCN
jgi:hypothetical protein